MRNSYIFLTAALCILASSAGAYLNAQDRGNPVKLLDVRKIWEKAPHNAFTDLIRFKGEWFCTFREAKNHWSPGAHGVIRVIASHDGEEWHSAVCMSMEGDLRDPKLCITPENRLMLLCFRRFNPTAYPDKHEQTFVYFSSDGRMWSNPAAVGFPNRWLWRITWHEGRAYGVSRGGPEGEKPFLEPRTGRVLASDDGTQFKPLADAGAGGESAIRFNEEGTAYCLLRSDKNEGFLGTAYPPYKNWEWKKLGIKIGGPDLIELPDGRWVAAGRLYDGRVRTSLLWLDTENGRLEEFLTLPSGGDTSYPGLVWHEGVLWVSYYSSHESKTAIYLAKVKID